MQTSVLLTLASDFSCLNIGVLLTMRRYFQVSTSQVSGKRILSEHIEVEVYKRLQLHPEYIYLVPGASYAVNVLFESKH